MWSHTLLNSHWWTRPCACTNSCSAGWPMLGVMFGTSCFNFSVVSFAQVQGSPNDPRHPTWCRGNCSIERSEGTALFWERGLHLAEPAPGASRSNYPKGLTLGLQKTMLTSNRHHDALDHGLVRISVEHTKYSKLTSQLLSGIWILTFTHCCAEKEKFTVTLFVPTKHGEKRRHNGSVGMVLRLWKQEILAINQLPMKGTSPSQQRIWPRTLLLRYLSITIKYQLRLSFPRSRNHQDVNLWGTCCKNSCVLSISSSNLQNSLLICTTILYFK